MDRLSLVPTPSPFTPLLFSDFFLYSFVRVYFFSLLFLVYFFCLLFLFTFSVYFLLSPFFSFFFRAPPPHEQTLRLSFATLGVVRLIINFILQGTFVFLFVSSPSPNPQTPWGKGEIRKRLYGCEGHYWCRCKSSRVSWHDGRREKGKRKRGKNKRRIAPSRLMVDIVTTTPFPLFSLIGHP